ncbi:uncharacterized protein LOC134216300 [Armigeres subalbatus]|uniref:uncharacterized protein LOC134216300 n=1 Tax=Armigeres subalbatus TaxID=124917 RepID=UPI002ED2EAA8
MQDVSEFNISFVKLIEAQPCLYDTSDEDYSRTQVQDRCWAKIARAIGPTVTIKECKNRWKNLRGRFTRHLKSFESTDPVENNKRPYYLAEHLEFLLPFTKPKRLAGDFDDIPYEDNISRFLEIDSSISDNIIESEDLAVRDEPETKHPNRAPSEIGHHDDGLEHDTHHIEQEFECINNSKKRKASLVLDATKMYKKIRRLSSSGDGQRRYVGDFSDECSKPQPAHHLVDYRDSDVLFLMSLLPDLKRMSDIQKRNYKIGILRLGGDILHEDSAQPSTSSIQSRNSSHTLPDSGASRSQRNGVLTNDNGEMNENSTSN